MNNNNTAEKIGQVDFSDLVEALEWKSTAVVEQLRHKKAIVQGFIFADSINWFYGAPDSKKTFTALDIAMCVATGTPWMGREVAQGAVLFIAAEGGDDIHLRRQAWAEHYGKDGLLHIVKARPEIDAQDGLQKLKRILEPIANPNERAEDTFKEFLEQVDDELEFLSHQIEGCAGRIDNLKRWDEFPEKIAQETTRKEEYLKRRGEVETERKRIEKILSMLEDPATAETLNPRLVVIDTYAQTASDDTKDAVNRYTRNLKNTIEQAIPGAAILVIDHTTKGGDTWMGSQGKFGNPEMMAAVEAKGDITTIRMDGRRGKIKYAAPFDPIHLQMKTVELPQLDAYGRNLSTLVCTDGSKAKRLSEAISSDTTATAAILEILNNSDDPMSRDELRELYANLPENQGKKKDSVGKAFRRAIKQLFEDELIIEENEKISTT
jgi:hypothetical protein